MHRLAVAALVAPLLGSVPLAAQEPFVGPLGVSERNPFYELFYVPVLETADVLPAGALRLDVTHAYSNIFEWGESDAAEQYFDLERLTSTWTLRHALGSAWEIGGRMSVQASWGGFLDPLVEGLHDAFGLPNGDRERVRQNQYGVELRDRRGDLVYRAPRRTISFEDPQVFVKWGARRSDRGALSVRATTELPLGQDGTGTGRADAALEVLARRSWTRWHLHGMAGVTTVNAPEWARPWAHRAATYLALATERTFGPTSLLAQWALSTPYLGDTGIDELDDLPSLLTVAVAGQRRAWRWALGFVEDVPPNGPSVDFTVHLQLWRAWP
ncbi:MAG: DUF3187 family protein [Gemmatimonadota bacterium]|nr:DUF3187 family protein [Gemmatimonadota bacterium]